MPTARVTDSGTVALNLEGNRIGSMTPDEARAFADELRQAADKATRKIPGGFKAGDVVAGPFVLSIPSPGPRILDNRFPYGVGIGVVDPSVRWRDPRYVPVRITTGSRVSGGYRPEHLTKIPNATS